MKITFKNFGSLELGTVELKPLTLLCGANNTGKTYVLYAIYGLMRLVDGELLPSLLRPDLETLRATGSVTLNLEELLRQHWTELENHLGKCLTDSLPYIFAAEPDGFQKADIKYSNSLDEALALARALDLPNPGEPMIPPTGARRWQRLLRFTKPAGSLEVTISQLANIQPIQEERIVAGVIKSLLLLPWAPQPVLLPAERAGLNLFYRELTMQRASLLHHASRPNFDAEGVFRHLSRYPVPIADYLDILNDLGMRKLQTGIHQEIAKDLQAKLLGIKDYRVDQDGNVSFTPNDSESAVNLHLGSSTVKSLFGLWFYLEHLSEQGGTLMIDEPELSLHPASQCGIARIIARLVNRGTKVILSTHSDYIVKELNSLLMLGAKGGKGLSAAKEHGFREDELLKPEQVAAYHFSGKSIAPMEITPEEGILADTFDDVIRALNQESQEIFNELSEETD